MHFDQLRRRDFITLLGGAAASWPLAQWVAFERRMGELGYQEGRNFSFD